LVRRRAGIAGSIAAFSGRIQGKTPGLGQRHLGAGEPAASAMRSRPQPRRRHWVEHARRLANSAFESAGDKWADGLCVDQAARGRLSSSLGSVAGSCFAGSCLAGSKAPEKMMKGKYQNRRGMFSSCPALLAHRACETTELMTTLFPGAAPNRRKVA
jgi:hypothetical protein